MWNTAMMIYHTLPSSQVILEKNDKLPPIKGQGTFVPHSDNLNNPDQCNGAKV